MVVQEPRSGPGLQQREAAVTHPSAERQRSGPRGQRLQAAPGSGSPSGAGASPAAPSGAAPAPGPAQRSPRSEAAAAPADPGPARPRGQRGPAPTVTQHVPGGGPAPRAPRARDGRPAPAPRSHLRDARLHLHGAGPASSISGPARPGSARRRLARHRPPLLSALFGDGGRPRAPLRPGPAAQPLSARGTRGGGGFPGSCGGRAGLLVRSRRSRGPAPPGPGSPAPAVVGEWRSGPAPGRAAAFGAGAGNAAGNPAGRDGRAPGAAPAAAAGQGIPSEPPNQPKQTAGHSGPARTNCLELVAPGEVPLGAAMVLVLITLSLPFALSGYLIGNTR